MMNLNIFNTPHFKYIALILVFVTIVSVFVSCEKEKTTLSKSEMTTIVNEQNKLLANCFISGNADKLSQMYTDSAKLSPNGYLFVTGRDSINAFWREDFKTSKILKMETEVLTVDGSDNLIYETGFARSEILYNDSVYHTCVKYINVWCKQPDGHYLLDVDFWNKSGI
jgi:ketosteroid isomerase-like protein